MRLNRGTIILLVISLAVIIGVVVISNNQANQPQAVTPTPAGGGPLFEGLTADQVISLAVRDNTTGEFTRLSREPGEDWQVAGPQDLAANQIDQGKATDAINSLVVLASDSTFEAEDYAAFGLAQPAYTIEVDTGGERLDVILVGSRNPSGNRYYVIPSQIEVTTITDATEEATQEAQTGGGAIQLVNQTALQQVINLVTSPPYVPTATPTVTPAATLNPLSEVQMATAAAESQATLDSMLATISAEATASAEATVEATSESTAEATAEATESE